jgi:radical SAM protein with 4Fe4S-binding SPASM domain
VTLALDFELPGDGRTPVVASILLSDHCNHACTHCYQVHGKKGELTLGELEHTLDQLRELGVLVLSLSGGESTLRKDLPEILAAARARGFAIVLMTNAYEISDTLFAAIIATGVWEVRVSVYSDVAAEHDAVTRVPGSFDATVGNIRRLVAAGIRATMVCTLTSSSTTTTARMEVLAATIPCGVEVSTGITAKEDASLTSLLVEPSSAQVQALYRDEIARSPAPLPREERLEKSLCGACSSGMTIHSDGSARPCTHIPVELADVTDLRQVAESDAYKFIGGIRWKHLHGCRDCELVSYCSRCHGSAAYETGDMLGPQPSACRMALDRFRARHGEHVTLQGESRDVTSTQTGPFAVVTSNDGVSGVTLARKPDQIGDEDLALRERFPWVVPSPDHVKTMLGRAAPPPLLPASWLVRRDRDTSTTTSTATAAPPPHDAVPSGR